MIEIFTLIAIIIQLIVLVFIIFFIYRIYKRNDSIDKIHYLICDNNSRINDVYKIIMKYRELIDEEVENINK